MPEIQGRAAFREYGVSGTDIMSGMVRRDPKSELQGQRGMEQYDLMRLSDPTVAAVLLALTLPVREADWQINPASEEQADVDAAKFIDECFKDMSHSFDDMLTEACTMFPFGWALLEWTLKKRKGRRPRRNLPASNYDDGRVGLRKLRLRPQTTLWEWETDPQGGITAMVQDLSGCDVGLLQEGFTRKIPLAKSVLFRTTTENNNPEGLSILRPCWRDWKFKREIERMEAIGLGRAMMGVPVFTLGQGATGEDNLGSSSHEAKAKDLIKGLYDNTMLGIIEEADILTFRLESADMTGVTGDSTRVIQRKDEGIARAALASWLLLGTRERGSYALAKELGDMFFICVQGFLDNISQTLSRWLIPVLFDWNNFTGLTGLPEVSTAINRRVDLEAISKVIEQLVGVNVLTPDLALEQRVREMAGLPRRVVELSESGEPITPTPEGETPEGEIAPEEQPVEEQKPERASNPAEFFSETFLQSDYGSAAHGYEEQLISAFDAWAASLATQMSRLPDSDAWSRYRAEDWPEAVGDLIGSLQHLAWREFPRAYALGYKSPKLTLEARAEIDHEVLQNRIWMETKLQPAIEEQLGQEDWDRLTFSFSLGIDTGQEELAALLARRRRHASDYSGHHYRMAWLGAVAYWMLQGIDFPVRWAGDPLAEHCSMCGLWDGMEFPSLQAMLTYTGGIVPGQGTQCDGKCRCRVVRQDRGGWVVI